MAGAAGGGRQASGGAPRADGAGPARVADGPGPARVAEIIGSLCLATDLGMGFPWEHGLHDTLMAVRLCDVLGLDVEQAQQTYYAALLMYSGCTADTSARFFGGSVSEHVIPGVFGSPREQVAGLLAVLPEVGASPLHRASQVAARFPAAVAALPENQAAICDVAEMLAARMGLPESMSGLFAHLTDRWDGRGILRRGRSDEIPLPIRITVAVRDTAYQRVLHGDEGALKILQARAGGALDPWVVHTLVRHAREVFAAADDVAGSAWEATLAAEPGSPMRFPEGGLDRALGAMGAFADLVSPHLAGHASAVSAIASAAATQLGLPAADVLAIRRAGQVEDIGRAGVPIRAWARPTRPTAAEQEQIRLHPYYTERILSPSSELRTLAPLAACHHERLDGSGYHRGVPAPMLPLPARVLAVADAFMTMTETRSYRPAMTAARAAARLAREARDEKFDAEAVEAVVEAAGEPPIVVERPAGLTRREAEVVELLARDATTRQIATRLGISAKTADRHIQHAYRKIGTSSRAGATLFAMEHGLVPWGSNRGEAARSGSPGPEA